MAVFTAWVIQAGRYGLTHQWIRSVRFFAAAPHVIDQYLTAKGKALRTRITTLVDDYRGNPPLLPLLSFSGQIRPLAGCSDRHVCIICQGMTGSVGILHTSQPTGKHILCSHIHSFLISPSTGICIDLCVIDCLTILIICLTQDCCLRPFHIICSGLDQRFQLPIIQPEELRRPLSQFSAFKASQQQRGFLHECFSVHLLQ